MGGHLVSIIIPSRNEKFLSKTINDILEKAKGEIETIAVLDGYWSDIINEPRVKYLHIGTSKGMRNAINQGVALSSGQYILKCDGHVMFDEGFDVKLLEDIEDNWVVVPRRKRLDADNWCLQDVGKPDIDYMYLSFPDNPQDFGGPGLNGKNWESKNRDPKLKETLIDDLMSAQGSCWFMKKDYFYQLELMDEQSYGTFWNEAQEIMLKAWLSGGRCIVNKKTWYAHLHKGKKHGRGYNLDHSQLNVGAAHTKKWITNSAWAKQTLPFEYLIEKFWPIPGWPEDWKTQLYGK
jgi:glycosyltransferase involved in cell wall biosynthesis